VVLLFGRLRFRKLSARCVSAITPEFLPCCRKPDGCGASGRPPARRFWQRRLCCAPILQQPFRRGTCHDQFRLRSRRSPGSRILLCRAASEQPPRRAAHGCGWRAFREGFSITWWPWRMLRGHAWYSHVEHGNRFPSNFLAASRVLAHSEPLQPIQRAASQPDFAGCKNLDGDPGWGLFPSSGSSSFDK